MPVAVICGHTLPLLQLNKNKVNPDQIAYFGLRDMDSLEFLRLEEYNMCLLETEENIKEWIKNFDKIYISFDVDCLDPSIMKSVNTPVKNGLSMKKIKNAFKYVKNSNKLIALDIVEYNPTIENNCKPINDILDFLL